MQNNSKMIVILAIIVVVIAGISVYYITNDDDKAVDDVDLTGYWYQIAYQGYNDGNFTESDRLKDSGVDYSMQIDRCCDGTLYGVFNDERFNATFVDNRIQFVGTISGSYTWLDCIYDNGHIFLTKIQESETNLYVFYAVYSLDPNEVYNISNNGDISGDWKAYEMTSFDGETHTLFGENVNVTEQNGNVFIGTMEQLVGDSVSKLDMVGVLGNYRNGGYTIGYAYVADEVWFISLKGDEMSLRTVMSSTSNSTLDKYVSVDRSYSRDGTAPSSDNAVELAGTTWTMINGSEASFVSVPSGGYVLGSIDKMYYDFRITFEEQVGKHLVGSAIYFGDEYDVYGCIGAESFVGMIFTSVDDPTYVLLFVATVDGNDLDVVTWSEDNESEPISDSVHLTKDVEKNADLIGHWYCNVVIGIDENEEFNGYFSSQFEQGNLYALDISSLENNLFKGYYNNVPVVGTFADGRFSFCGTSEAGEYAMIEGYVLNNNTISLVERFVLPDGTLQSWLGLYGKESIFTSISPYSYDFDGSWTVVDDLSYAFDGAINPVSENTLTLENRFGLLYGNLKSEVNGKTVNAVVVGSVYEDNNGVAKAILYDKVGTVYRLSIFGESLISYSFSEDPDGDCIVEMLIYTRDGTAPGLTPSYFDIDDMKWETTSSIMIDVDGSESSLIFTLTVTDQYENAFLCTIETEGGDIFETGGYIIRSSGETNIVISTNMTDIFFGTFNEDMSRISLTLSCFNMTGEISTASAMELSLI